ncbi:MAG: PPOX class F420-dependent oxidoreductase [Nitrososphaeraceae archaeon]
MNKQINDNLNNQNIRELFERKNFAFLSSLMGDGSPQVTPTWVDIENGYILINTAIGRIKEKNISRDPRVALAIADQNNPYDMVTIRGKVIEQIRGDIAEEHIDKLAKKYIGKEKYPRTSPGEKRVLLKIKPEKIFHMHQ